MNKFEISLNSAHDKQTKKSIISNQIKSKEIFRQLKKNSLKIHYHHWNEKQMKKQKQKQNHKMT